MRYGLLRQSERHHPAGHLHQASDTFDPGLPEGSYAVPRVRARLARGILPFKQWNPEACARTLESPTRTPASSQA